MTDNALITPFDIVTELPADQEPEPPYSWPQQVRNEDVPREALQKQQRGLGGQRLPGTVARDPGSDPSPPAQVEAL
jgi:hypothetical protein